jgi:hypothetical protein
MLLPRRFCFPLLIELSSFLFHNLLIFKIILLNNEIIIFNKWIGQGLSWWSKLSCGSPTIRETVIIFHQYFSPNFLLKDTIFYPVAFEFLFKQVRNILNNF